MSSKKALVTTTEKIDKEGINDMGTKPNVMKEAINPPIEKNNIDIVNKTEKLKASQKKIHPAAINMTKVNHWINQGLLKELKQKTQ